MIRVNLLPQKREVRRESVDQRWLIATGAAVLGVVLVATIVQKVQLDALDDEKRRTAEIQSQIDTIKNQLKSHDTVKSQLQGLRAREEAISKLQSARSGPTAVLLEIAQVLSSGRGPTVDPDALAQLRNDNPGAVFNPSWDARRLWLSSYSESGRTVHVDGLARDGDDVSELARRLGLSKYFADVKLLPATRAVDADSKIEFIHFELQAKARY